LAALKEAQFSFSGVPSYGYLPNAAPEWQAMSLRWPDGELVVACPLKGLVRSAQILYDLVKSFLVAEI
jgi:hypothetical protein